MSLSRGFDPRLRATGFAPTAQRQNPSPARTFRSKYHGSDKSGFPEEASSRRSTVEVHFCDFDRRQRRSRLELSCFRRVVQESGRLGSRSQECARMPVERLPGLYFDYPEGVLCPYLEPGEYDCSKCRAASHPIINNLKTCLGCANTPELERARYKRLRTSSSQQLETSKMKLAQAEARRLELLHQVKDAAAVLLSGKA